MHQKTEQRVERHEHKNASGLKPTRLMSRLIRVEYKMKLTG